MTAPASISVVLPAFDEAAVIGRVISETVAALREEGLRDFEIVVVDDGSTDGTGDVARAAAEGGAPVRVVRHEVNRGYGAALRSGFEAAAMEAVWLMDADAQFDPRDLRRLTPAYGPNVTVVGFREHRRDTWMRRLNHAAFFGLVSVLFGPTVRDVNCAFKLFPRGVGLGLTSEGAMISTELILRARRAGFQIAEVAVPHYPRTTGRATGADPRVVLRAFRELWGLRRNPAAFSGLISPEPASGDA